METKQAPYTIYAEMTPNPNTMKFVSNRWLLTNDKSYEILANQRVGGPSPLAEKLFNFPFINGVFITGNFVTITKSDKIEWNDVVMELRDFITSYLNSDGMQVIREELIKDEKEGKIESEVNVASEKSYSDIEKKIIEILDEYIKPAVESDGGAIEFVSFDYGVLKVVLKGACSGCPSSTMTLKGGIESLMKNMLPEVQAVEAVNG
ncbi:MAG: NifU family protein [Flavobacteriales bacterium CG_4_10_14_0_2_um_filter_32_8]|nr:MAG: NifU family protein [Flavobacteriales bacterium CG_4_10_14_0_2_um_filter_32_8]PJB16278.1 MAG: NifU family protein [Flavobacteriales bacterium CG_4_9_14_3_um_filter_32_8]